jgi:hypothetical protein
MWSFLDLRFEQFLAPRRRHTIVVGTLDCSAIILSENQTICPSDIQWPRCESGIGLGPGGISAICPYILFIHFLLGGPTHIYCARIRDTPTIEKGFRAEISVLQRVLWGPLSLVSIHL